MLDIDIDSKMGILFVRLFGRLTKETRSKLNEEVINLIYNVGIRNIVLNIQNLSYIDDFGINTLIKCYKVCDNSLICANPSQISRFGGLNCVTDERTAANLIGI